MIYIWSTNIVRTVPCSTQISF